MQFLKTFLKLLFLKFTDVYISEIALILPPYFLNSLVGDRVCV